MSNPKYTRENKTGFLKWTSNLIPFEKINVFIAEIAYINNCEN